jgi:hypothetical protein
LDGVIVELCVADTNSAKTGADTPALTIPLPPRRVLALLKLEG